MARITIVGSGIIGMATASLLARTHEIMIVARDLPGDKPTIDWASPWAGANFIAGGCTDPREKKMQLDAFAELWRLSISNPESSLRQITIEDILDVVPEDQIWWKDFVPEFRFLSPEEMPKNAKLGISYKTVVCNPLIFLPWFRKVLEAQGVRFMRMDLKSLSDVKVLGQDVIVNATGIGSQKLADINDQDVEMIWGQTIVCKSDYKKVFMRDDGKTYTYAIPRLDGTVIVGGIRRPGSTSTEVDWDVSRDIVRRVHANLPDHFPADVKDYDIIGHNVGIRPSRSSGIRVEKETREGQNIVHAYGFGNGGYIYSFGVARAVRELIDEFLFPSTLAKL